MGAKAASGWPQLTCVLFCLAALSNISPAEAPKLLWIRIAPEEVNRQFQRALLGNIHDAVPLAYFASMQDCRHNEVTRPDFLKSVAGKAAIRLKQHNPGYTISVFIWDEWSEDENGVVTEGPLAGEVSDVQYSYKDSAAIAPIVSPTAPIWDWTGSGGGSLHVPIDLSSAAPPPAAAGSSSPTGSPVSKLGVMVYLSKTREGLYPEGFYPEPARQVWRLASAEALNNWSDPPIYMVGISESTYNEWVAGMTATYGDVGANSIRGLHACLAEGCGYHVESHLFMLAHAHTRPVDVDNPVSNPEIIMALLPNNPRFLQPRPPARPVVRGK